ncbi:MAG: ABC transporter permease [Chloroflexi bacterium]|nr:ABC transporter permease [Chloroflexota bacterium]MCZ6789650.1 ABC transporter permease [Chloroflexota bacterium]MCZ6891985.1 ABC transporter permease [Chloroflexota bacterium]
MSILRETYYLYIRNLKVWIAQPMAVISPILTAALMFLVMGAPLRGVTQLPGFPSDDYNAYLTGMIIVMTIVFGGGDVAMAALTDILSGYFDKLLLAPINRFSILMGILLVAGTRALSQVVVIVLIATLLGVTFQGGLLGIAVVIVAATAFGIASACLGLIIALKTKSPQVTMSTWLLFMPLAFLTTAFMPKELLSGWFKVAVTINPVEYVLVGLRTIIIQGWQWETILPGLWALLAMMAVMGALTTWLFRRETA